MPGACPQSRDASDWGSPTMAPPPHLSQVFESAPFPPPPNRNTRGSKPPPPLCPATPPVNPPPPPPKGGGIVTWPY